MLMINPEFFRSVKADAEHRTFKIISGVTADQAEKQRHIELAVRFLVHTFIPYTSNLDVEEFIDDGVVNLCQAPDIEKYHRRIVRTFTLLYQACGKDALRRYDGQRHSGKVTLVAIEAIAVGVSKNITRISALTNSIDFVREKIRDFWMQDEISRMTSPGLRGTTRIQRTVPFGTRWFRP